MDDKDNLIIARVLEGGMIEKQGLLHIGDIILEVNGTPVKSPEGLQTEIAKSKDSVTFKIGQMKDTNDITHSALIMANGNANRIVTKLTVYIFFNPMDNIITILFLTVLHASLIRIHTRRRHLIALQGNRTALRQG